MAPIAKVLCDNFGIENGFMTTIHAYTGDQKLVDGSHSNKRRARSAGLSIVPTSTGAAKALGLVLPQLKGRIDGVAMRVPVANVSCVDLKVEISKKSTIDEINLAFKRASENQLKGVLGYENEELVSVDFNHNSNSAIFDATQTMIMDGKHLRVCAWYDNEWGFSMRMLDTAREMFKA
jgi:glyceraldehyde 3-phosphate dehydrogenase